MKITSSSPTGTRHPRGARRRPAALPGIAALGCVLVGVALVGLAVLRGGPEQAPSAATGAPGPAAAPSTSSPLPPSPSAAPVPVYRLAGVFPGSGPGTWTYAATGSRVFGTAGRLERFRVGAEKNIARDELPEFVRTVDLALGDPRSWTAGRRHRLQRVAAGSSYDFTIYLATGETTRRLCAEGGMDTRVDGVSYTSCRLPGRVVINLNRWRLSVPDYVRGEVELSAYRLYVINHEVGHELGRNHEKCPGKGRPAPTMQQQTFGLKGCVANPWPYLDGRRYAGPPL